MSGGRRKEHNLVMETGSSSLFCSFFCLIPPRAPPAHDPSSSTQYSPYANKNPSLPSLIAITSFVFISSSVL